MTSKQDYSSTEWQLLLDVPPAVGTAMMVAGRSGAGSIKEAVTLATEILAARRGYEDVELVSALVKARTQDGEKSAIETLSSPYRNLSPDEIAEDAVFKCRQVHELLTENATPYESERFIDWVLDIAEAVAKAAKEGDFLGFGGERVSVEERRLLKQLQSALGVT